jgi:hypothetical protein
MSLQRTPCFIPPQYDIDSLLNVDFTSAKNAFDVVDQLCTAIEKRPPGGILYFRPDSALLLPEVVVRDLYNFVISMGSGFSASLGYGGGFTCFFRALRALRIIQHRKGLALAEAVRDVMVANGAREPSNFADDPREGADVDWDKELEDVPDFDDRIQEATRHLDEEWFALSHCVEKSDPSDPPLHVAICFFLEANRELLRCRKGSHVA